MTNILEIIRQSKEMMDIAHADPTHCCLPREDVAILLQAVQETELYPLVFRLYTEGSPFVFEGLEISIGTSFSMWKMMENVHATAKIEESVHIGDGTKVWHTAHIRQGAKVGNDCIIGRNVFIDTGVIIGDRCKIQNNALIYKGAVIGDGVFIGPAVSILNDKRPRAVTPLGALKGAEDWSISGVTIEDGASIGGGAILLPGVSIGAWSMVGAGSVVTRVVGPGLLVKGNPANTYTHICKCGVTVDEAGGKCPACSVLR